MSPAEAARTLDAAKALGTGRPHLRLVGSLDSPIADGPGMRLQVARQDQELSIYQVASALKLKAEQVAAIESMQFQKLPGLGYALGYVRAYGELLGLVDCDGLVNEFRDTWEPVQRRRESEIKIAPSQFVAPVGALIALGLLAWLIIWAAVHATHPRTQSAIAPPDASIKAWAEAKPVAAESATAYVPPLSTLKAIKDVRITLRGEDGALVTDRILRAGEEVSTDGLGRWFVSAPFGGSLVASGYGQTAIIGEGAHKVENWRVPDFAQIAADKAKEEARLAAEAAAAVAAKAAPKVSATTVATTALAPSTVAAAPAPVASSTVAATVAQPVATPATKAPN